MSIVGQGTLIAGRGRERYQNVWIVLFKFTYIVSSLVPAQMMTLTKEALSWENLCKAKLRSVVVTRRLYKKKIADKRKILVEGTKFRTY